MKRAPSPVRFGMRADDVLKLRGRGKKDAVAQPTMLDRVTAGWHYADCTVALRHDGRCYRVVAVIPVKGEVA